jgi:hypothetical protein
MGEKGEEEVREKRGNEDKGRERERKVKGRGREGVKYTYPDSVGTSCFSESQEKLAFFTSTAQSSSPRKTAV